MSVSGSGEETGAGEESGSGVGASASGGAGVGGRGEGFAGGDGLGARVSPPGDACSFGGGGDGGGGEPAGGLVAVATVVVIWEDNFLSRLRRRGGETAGDAGRARSSTSSKGSVSMAARLGLSSPRRDR